MVSLTEILPRSWNNPERRSGSSTPPLTGRFLKISREYPETLSE
jgi:hypothetical protein